MRNFTEKFTNVVMHSAVVSCVLSFCLSVALGLLAHKTDKLRSQA